MDFHKYSFSKLAFMLKVTSKSENETFFLNYTNLWVYRNLSRHATWHQRSYRKSKSTEQYDCKLFFRLDGTRNSLVEFSNSTGWDFESTIKFNVSAGEEYCEWFVCGVCGIEVTLNIMYQSNRTLNNPPGNLPGIWIFGKFLENFPFPRPKSCSNAPL